jgi:hypothetical protein
MSEIGMAHRMREVLAERLGVAPRAHEGRNEEQREHDRRRERDDERDPPGHLAHRGYGAVPGQREAREAHHHGEPAGHEELEGGGVRGHGGTGDPL